MKKMSYLQCHQDTTEETQGTAWIQIPIIRHIRLNLSQNNSAGTKYAFQTFGFSSASFPSQSGLTTSW